jgi:gluconate 2-dehydrogenase gamma chain
MDREKENQDVSRGPEIGGSETNSISRRDILKSLGLGATSSSFLKLVALPAAVCNNNLMGETKAGAPVPEYAPKFFGEHQYKTLQALCQAIIPPDEHSGGAVEAGAPEFIDLLTSENKDYQVRLGGGLMWLDSTCRDRYGKVYLDCSTAEQKEILNLIAYRSNSEKDSGLRQGITFFAFLRKLTADAFYTSEIGIKDLQYIGNTYRAGFPGCPPVPET